MCLVHQVLPTARGVPGWSFVLEHRSVRFFFILLFVSRLETIFCYFALVEVPPQQRKAETLPRLAPHLSHRCCL